MKGTYATLSLFALVSVHLSIDCHAFSLTRKLCSSIRRKHTYLAAIRTLPNEDESWFVKTEQFCRPFPEVKPHLESHRLWVENLRSKGHCITSGYRVDNEAKLSGGGLMIFAARTYAEAEELVLQDPLVANNCVNWTLNGWVSEVGDLQLR